MANSYKTIEGDRIDIISLKHYGSQEMLPHVIGANPQLHKIPLSLAGGITIVLPAVVDTAKEVALDIAKEEETLW